MCIKNRIFFPFFCVLLKTGQFWNSLDIEGFFKTHLGSFSATQKPGLCGQTMGDWGFVGALQASSGMIGCVRRGIRRKSGGYERLVEQKTRRRTRIRLQSQEGAALRHARCSGVPIFIESNPRLQFWNSLK
jgi:hypothetical protein